MLQPLLKSSLFDALFLQRRPAGATVLREPLGQLETDATPCASEMTRICRMFCCVMEAKPSAGSEGAMPFPVPKQALNACPFRSTVVRVLVIGRGAAEQGAGSRAEPRRCRHAVVLLAGQRRDRLLAEEPAPDLDTTDRPGRGSGRGATSDLVTMARRTPWSRASRTPYASVASPASARRRRPRGSRDPRRSPRRSWRRRVPTAPRTSARPRTRSSSPSTRSARRT